MKYKHFQVLMDNDGTYEEIELDLRGCVDYCAPDGVEGKYIKLPVPPPGFKIYAAIYYTIGREWVKFVISEKDEETVFMEIIPQKQSTSLQSMVHELVPMSSLFTDILGRTFYVKDENTFVSHGYYNDEDDCSEDIELRVFNNPYIKIGQKEPVPLRKKDHTHRSGGMSFDVLNVGGIGLALAYTNTKLPTRIYVEEVKEEEHASIDLDIHMRVTTTYETNTTKRQRIKYLFQ